PEEAEEIARRRFLCLRSTLPNEFAWINFPCADYLASEWSGRGFWCENSQYMVIVPAWEAKVLDDIGLFVVGGPGVDGIPWGYRRGEPGLWSYSLIDNEFTYLAPTVAGLIEMWRAGELAL
ncbi:MAG: hypothetical protein U0790_21440, partial [Isosphaeraceae bacterium]